MSDKSFGDHVNRNIVKNPLLSTAVTGLSIEDLTHNAVLLPAAPTQPLITRSEYQIGTQAHTLEHPDNELANHPSGDSNSNIPPSHHSITSAQSTLNIQTSTQSDLASDNLRSTQSKAFPKSEDDFDVNEYFARLQGTRYVSAPLHSQISDQNANLDAEEDNLEEINLNDDKPDTQQSITADIAQNFSQLPTVLPHMASAVFSSFSNMLNLKSREHTPDEGKVQSVTQADTVPLMSVENVAKEIAPPPKEMSVSGASNYRITTKKKYAQIPGLSSGETQPVAYNPVSQAVPSYFVPSVQDSCVNFGEHVDNTKQVDESRNEQAKPSTSENNFNIFQPIDNDDAVKSYSNRIEEIKPAIIDPFSVHNPINVAADVKECDFQPIIPLLPANDSEINFPHSQLAMQANVIPPPPMFSTQRRDSQNTGKAVLPPSVARRIGSNHPVIKQQTIQTTKLADNIFVPTFDPLPTNEALQSVHEPPSVPVSHAPTFAETQALNDSVQSATQTQFSSLPPAKSFIPFSRPMQTTIGFQPSTSFVAPPKNQAATNLQLHTLAPLPSNTPTIFTPPTLLPSTAVPSAVTNIFTPKETEAHLLPPMSSQSVAVTSAAKPGVSSMFESQSSTNLPPFYNTMSIQDNTNPKIPGPLYPPPDEPKSLQIPPKSSGGVNYRMTKKRPQYYSGPIEGVGAISNNTKPVLPPIETGTFQGALFTPEQGIQPNPNVTSTPFDISQNIATVAFDISQPKLRMASTSFDISQNTATVPFDISGAPSSQTAMVFDMSNSGDNAPHSSHVKPQEQAQSYFNTVFDLSRPTTETYHEETKETTGFGIIGSLKSKLSSLDINKIQNTVTTFFDPAFNESKNDNSNAQETAPYQTSQYQGQSNFEILVPNIQETPQAYGSYDSQSQNSYFQSNQYYSNQQNYYQSQDQTLTGLYQSPEVSYPNYSTFAAQTQLTSTESIAHSSLFNPQGLINTSTQEKLKESGENVTLFSDRSTKSDVLGHTNKDMEKTASHFDIFQDSSKIDQTLQAQDILSVEEKSATNYFDMSTSKSADIHAKTYDVDKEPTFLTAVHAPSKEKSNTDLFSPIKYEQQNVHAFVQPSSFHSMATSIEDYKSVDVFSTKFDAKSTKQKFPKADNLLESISRDEIPIVGVSSVPLFGLSTMIVGKTKESIEVEDTKMPSLDKDLIDRNASISFFENIPPIKPVDDENVSELNICETCREFNKPEENDKELDDLTTQLIENITSPIQLSNPVEVPLTEGSTAVNDNDNEFDKNQFEEISHITEETIETIQVQSATELLDDVDEDLPRNYGWATQEDYDSSSINTNVLLEHDYNFKIDTNSLGFYGNNSLFFDNVPTNASDEIKAEFKHHEDFPKEVPTAPPVEDDTKSDETGVLDVQSIELDAKKDFPIYEEFVIEPSETDDDKIEYKEREKTEESQERDTFTNRVERFKKMDNDDHNDHKTIFELSSPPISMASYFDTGNFAAETHYRKSISSPSQIRIPPGFEEEFHSRLTVTKPVHDIKTVPDTSTQTRPTEALSFSTVQNIAPVGFNIETNITKLVEEGSEKPPAFSTFLASEDRKKHIDIQPSIFSGLVTGLDGEKHFTAAIDTKEVSESESHIPGLVSSNLLSGDVTSVFGMQSDSKRINLVSGLIGANVTEDRHISNIYGDPKEDLSDIPTSLIPTNLVEDVNINRMFDQEAEITQKDWVATNLLDGTSLKPAFDGTDKRKDVDTPPTVAANVLPKSSAEDRLFTVGFVQKQDSNVNATTDIITALPTSNVFQGNDSTVKDQSKPEIVEVVDKTGKLPEFLSVFGPKTSAPKKEEQKLPDPMNFFSSGDNPVEAPETFNRLASYFASPPKTDHGKSFFELSQSQNHYRHDTVSIQTRNDKYSDLIKDLTSPQNITAPKDQIVRHINYFTVECNPELKKNQTGDIKNVIESAETENIAQIDNIFNKCEYCSKCLNCKNYKFRTLMDDTNPEKEKTGSNMDEAKDTSRRPVSVNFENITLHEEANEGVSMLSEGRSSPEYTSVKHHWFYRVDVEDKSIWRGFSIVDSKSLEMAYLSPDLTETTLVPTDGGRYDVNVVGRLRVPVYWDDKPTNVRRCSWFYKGATDARYVPYTEQVAEKLEEEYRHGMIRGEWHRRLLLPNGEVVVMHGPGVMVHFLHSSAADTFSSSPATTRPRVVRRGHDESEIEDTEPSSIDHLLLLCHGVGSACDMRFRSVEEVVEDFRATSLQLLQSHYRNSYDKGIVNRIEVLPISWHSSLHSGETGVDRRLAQITLHSIPRLRHFTNDTILDVLFYTSPVFCQTILDTVCRELNRIYKLFKQRNPDFKGGVSVGGHSLGSVILYDLLCNQTVEAETDTAKSQSQKTYVAGCSRMSMKYPILEFHPDSLYALGSPIAIFECIRGVESLGLNFDLPTCKNFFNIFHPYDPIAYRIEPLVNPELKNLKPFLIPHHKGRKRMHLELKDTMARVGADLKQKLLDSLRMTWNKWKAQPDEGHLSNVVEEEAEKDQIVDESREDSLQDNEMSTPEMLGRLNDGRRIDYVLQEAPLEMINEYIFAMSSHVGYWESEDTMLLMLREIYGALGVQPDSTVPQQTMTVQRARNSRQIIHPPAMVGFNAEHIDKLK